MRGARRHAAVWLTAGVLATAGCSGGNDDSAASSSTPASSSSAASSSAAEGGTYLALGDSVPFGYRGGEPPEAYANAADFVGYPQLVGSALGVDVVNTSCPGETTASFSDTAAVSNGCENRAGVPGGYRTTYPLHVAYDAADQSQLDLAVRTLKDTDDVSLVTLQLGANDGFLCQASTPDQCVTEATSVAQTVQQNLTTILATLRDQGGYTGKIIVVTYYALNYADPTGTAGIQLLNAGIAAAAKNTAATVVSGFDAFQPIAQNFGGDSIAAGLVLPNDVHPTARGQQVLADAVFAAAHG